jgi:hypothetical protein
MAKGADGRTFKTREFRPREIKKKRPSFAMLLVRFAFAILVILALVWGANQAMFFLFRHGLY